MKRTTGMIVVIALAACSASGAAGPAGGSTSGAADGRASGSGNIEAVGSAVASAEAKAAAEARKAEIRRRAAQASVRTRARAESRLEASRQRVDRAAARAEYEVAARLGAELGMRAEVLMAERFRHDAGWGELMIAHTLGANAGSDLAVDHLFQLRKEGMGWGSIAAGLGFELGQAVRAVEAEARVATGIDPADGRVAVARGPGAESRAAAGAGANTTADVHTGPIHVVAGTSANFGATTRTGGLWIRR